MERKRLRRMLQMLVLLPTHPMRNLASLAIDLKVDPRTIRRDGRLLARAGLARCEQGCIWIEPWQQVLVERLAMVRPPGRSMGRSMGRVEAGQRESLA